MTLKCESDENGDDYQTDVALKLNQFMAKTDSITTAPTTAKSWSEDNQPIFVYLKYSTEKGTGYVEVSGSPTVMGHVIPARTVMHN